MQFKEYMRYCRNLGFDQTPDYRFLRRLFKTALEERVGITADSDVPGLQERRRLRLGDAHGAFQRRETAEALP